MTSEPAWQLILEAATQLTRTGRSPFSLDSRIRHVRTLDPERQRSSIQPVVQGMTVNASGGPKSPSGEVLRRVERGYYELIESGVPLGDSETVPEVPSRYIDSIADLADVLSDIRESLEQTGEVAKIIEARDEVLPRYGRIFAPENLPSLTAETFAEFLLFQNNRHWDGIHRHTTAVTQDMDRLKAGLAILLDESRPIEDRLDQLIPIGGPNYVPHLGKAVLTPILLVVYPDRYGVWNSIAEGAIKSLDLWPAISRGESFGSRYVKVNAILLDLVGRTALDLWTLDALWWQIARIGNGPDPDSGGGFEPDPGIDVQRFGLERHLHEFLADNWDQTELGAQWQMYEEGGDVVGSEYPTTVGRIDLLAHHRTEPRWLVVELKRDQSDDQTVGQVARYMGWVRRNLAQPGDHVEGLVISAQATDKIRYALEVVPDVSLKTYEVEFRLTDPGALDE